MKMPFEPIIGQLEENLSLPDVAKERVWKRVNKRISGSETLAEANKALEPRLGAKDRVWARIIGRIDVKESSVLLDRLRELLSPPAGLKGHLHDRFLGLSSPVPFSVRRQFAFKWVAAVVLIAFFAKAGPQLFIAPRTVAESKVTLIPTRGETAIFAGGLWQPVQNEIILENGILLRTHQGEASIIFRDNGVVRMDSWTTVQVNDDAGNKVPETAIKLLTGRIWVQGLITPPLKGIEIETDNGTVAVQEGSVSIAENSASVDIEVWDRRAQVSKAAEDSVHLIAGEKISLSEGGVLFVKKIPEESFEDGWVVQNFKKDAVHRKSIAQLQQERRAARAGIIPNLGLFPAKRIAEKVDVMLTIGEEARAQKELDHAGSRLDEAAALIEEGETEAVKISLDDYKDSLLAMANESGSDAVQMLIQQSIAKETRQISAALPDDNAYLIKKTVLEASAEMPYEVFIASDARGVLLIDAITSLIRKADKEGAEIAVEAWKGLQGEIALIDDKNSGIKPEVIKEARMLMSDFAFIIFEASSAANAEMVSELSAYIPLEKEVPAVLSDEEIDAIVKGIKDRIFVYHMQKSRVNQLYAEFKALSGHPDQGRILRRLKFSLPDGPEELPLKVRKEIVRLQWERATE